MLIALAGYFEENGLFGSAGFAQWLAGRPELRLALQSIHTSPAAALAAIPPAAPPAAYRRVFAPGGAGGPGGAGFAPQVTEQEQREVLAKRRGRALTRRIILKSYLSAAPDPALPRGTPDVRKADGLQVFTGALFFEMADKRVAKRTRGLLLCCVLGAPGGCSFPFEQPRQLLMMPLSCPKPNAERNNSRQLQRRGPAAPADAPRRRLGR